MSNSGFLITDAGLAAASIAAPGGPYVHITAFKVGSAFNYTPDRAMTDLQGTVLYTGVASGYNILADDTIEVVLVMDASVGTFQFGEIGIYLESGELFALCVFENLQEKIRAIGNQAGNTWRIRSRLKLAQAPVTVTVELINSQGILEVAAWEVLAKPIDQIMGANIAIVHANNSSDEPVLVIRDNDNEWGLVDYSRIFSGGIGDVGAVLTTTSFQHPNLPSIFLEGMPRTDSRYLVKFPDGQIRKIIGYPNLNTIEWPAPGVNDAQTGTITIWAEQGSQFRINWADTVEYNQYVADFNPYWAAPYGPYRDAGPFNVPYPAENRGKGQTPIPTVVSRRTNLVDWALLLTAVRNNCQIHGISIADIASITDFVYRPTGPAFPGLQFLETQWNNLVAKIALLESQRNNFVLAGQDQSLIVTSSDNTFWSGVRTWRHTISYTDDTHLQALLNSGHQIQIDGFMENIINGDWYEFQDLLIDVGTIRVSHDTVVASLGSASGIGLQELTDVSQQLWTYTANNWTLTLQGRKPAGLDQIILDLIVNNTGTAPYAYTPDPPGEINFNIFSRRASTALLNTPILAHPTASFSIV